jgi:hypothetical protein
MPADPPSKPPVPPPTLQALAAEWAKAQTRFGELREAVEHASKLADLKAQADSLMKERDITLRGLGEAVWLAVQRGELTLPRAMSSRMRALEGLDQQRAAQAAEISALLMEGEELAARKQKKPPPAQSPLARSPKKR